MEMPIQRQRMLTSGHKAMLGRIVEPSDPEPTTCSRFEETSVAGHPHSYTHRALVYGVRWPSDVDPTCREQHMPASEFLRVMGLSYRDFRELPLWRQAELKKEMKLF